MCHAWYVKKPMFIPVETLVIYVILELTAMGGMMKRQSFDIMKIADS